ncbi:hypothetical protein [Streptomyces sp. uw30]|uniref:hypothetical protein n=1 Tax=Streptomyces sp. uw30 TaxID=1828179 RepID=UPI0011CECACD|nr:hypothetical protein [Streptomyces sp. uw30]
MSKDPQAVAQKLALLMQAEAASTDTKIRTLHPDWLDEQIRREVARTLKEKGVLAPGPAFFPPRRLDGAPASSFLRPHACGGAPKRQPTTCRGHASPLEG